MSRLDVLWSVLGWVAAALNVLGNLMLTTKGKKGWIVRIVCNVTWMPYGLYTRAWALIANHMLFVVINAYGWWKWRRDELREAAKTQCPKCRGRRQIEVLVRGGTNMECERVACDACGVMTAASS